MAIVPPNETRRVWEANRGFLYDVQLSYSLEWPSLTVQWLPGCTSDTSEEYELRQLMFATHTSSSAREHLIIADLRIPIDDEPVSDPDHPLVADLQPTFFCLPANYDGVHRARFMPQEPSMVATCSQTESVLILDVSQKSPESWGSKFDECVACECFGIKGESWTIAWSPYSKGHLVAGSHSGRLCLWDLNSAQGKSRINPANSWDYKEFPINAVDWSPTPGAQAFCSASEDGTIALWDVRQEEPADVRNMEDEVMSASFSPHDANLLATGSSDSRLRVWDLRMLKAQPLFALRHSSRTVSEVSWAKTEPSIIITNSNNESADTIAGPGRSDQRVWDLTQISVEGVDACEDICAPLHPLLFTHSQDTTVNDMAVCDESLLVATVNNKNLLDVWRMAPEVYLSTNGE